MKAFGNLGSRSFDSRDLCGFQRGIEGFACVSIYNFFFFFIDEEIFRLDCHIHMRFDKRCEKLVLNEEKRTTRGYMEKVSHRSYFTDRHVSFSTCFSTSSLTSLSYPYLRRILCSRSFRGEKKKKNFFHRFTFQRLSIFQSLVNNGGGTRIVIPNGERLKLGVFIQVWSLDARPGCNHFISTFTRELPGGGGPRQFARHFTILPIIKKKLYGKSRATRALASATGWFIVPPPIFCFALLAVLRLPSVIDSDLSVEKDDTRETIQERTVLEGRLNGVAKANSNDGAGRKVKC